MDTRTLFSSFYSAWFVIPVEFNICLKKSFIDAAERKKNFLRITQLVLIGGPEDSVIIPWESSIFGYYDNSLNMKMMENQDVCFPAYAH